MIDDARLNKVPAVTLAFWIAKIAATTLGETGGDAVSMSMNFGYLAATIRHEIGDRDCTGLRIGFFLPRIWNPVAGAAVDPWRFARDGDDRRLHRSRSVDAVTG